MIEELLEAVFGIVRDVENTTQDDYALAGPSKGD